ncbi:glycosyltransferase family 2 protein [Trichococcus collinsii]|uniref:Glycosyltransferase involved in cell wall bisynthesis n=1 Tax=Trichococcus collinsii TaxID=157076 RepID=A0AB38A143_9LACT|nr:glycosyltransferase family 2 protein [Trichococcus collinsii]CZQ92232.1 nucleotide-diphospho-sugar transferases [Trichococcus collinsii]SEA57313.1 Glycosyltransferase involved in cell wall bisynthesis [Trichococcus collinsii]
MSKELISIIVPCYNEEEMLPIFYEEIDRISKIMDYVTFEYIFVNDGSKDHTLKKLKELSNKDYRVRYFSFSRNFGKEAALFAGLEHAKGDYVAVMDVDLQDPPELLPEMYRLIQDEEYDCIGTRRKDREGEPIIRSFFARKFYKLINRISDTEIVDGARDFRLMKRQMVDAILNLSEYNRFSKGIFSWVGFETKYLEFQNKERVAGQTTWSFWSLFRYSLDGIVAFSEIPLAMASIVGFFTFAVAIILAIFFGVRTLIFGNPTSGWTSMIVIILALGGIQLLSLGIIGKYLGKTFLETKKRPIYILKEYSGKELRNQKDEDKQR